MKLEKITPGWTRVTFTIFEWDYSFDLKPRRVPVYKIGDIIETKGNQALIRLDDGTEVWKDIECLNEVPKFAEF